MESMEIKGTPRKYFRTVLSVEILSADKPWDGDVNSVGEDITNGHFSGMVLDTVETELTEAEIADALENQGSDPDFLIETSGGEVPFPALAGEVVEFEGQTLRVVDSPDKEDGTPEIVGRNDLITVTDGKRTFQVYRGSLQ